MNNTTGKRILHGICGVIIGAISGAVTVLGETDSKAALALAALCGAVVLGLLAFFFTDYFWEEFFNRD